MRHINSKAARDAINQLPDFDPTPLKSLFPGSPDHAIDLLEKLLKFDPSERITAADALKHPYFSEYHDYMDEDFSEAEKKFD